ncbi:hypothetical protein IAR50_005799 [Cryptococcus sp. DSM 104548]
MATHSPYRTAPFPSHAFPDPDDTPIPDDGDIDDEDNNIFRDMTFDEIMEDLNARFLINLPKEEMNLLRVYWQAEQAHWFYEDYLRPLNPLLPSLSQRHFTRLIIESSPLYKRLVSSGSIDHDSVWDDYRSYKRMVPCCGGIMLNKQGDKVVLVRGWKNNAGWSFPRGKINLNETEEACAVREVEEETGYDLTGMVKSEDRIQTHINAQEVTMFIVGGIDESTVFETQTRHEIGAIEWVNLTDLPTWSGNKKTKKNTNKRFYNVTPFVNPLKAWMKANGLNPHPKPRPKKLPVSQPAGSPGNFHRDIKPFQFDAFSGSPSASPQLHTPSPALSHLSSRDSSALDQLFTKFIHKQEEEILAPRQGDAVGSDNNAGLQRLFGGLDVLQEEEQAMFERQRRDAEQNREVDNATRYQKEDDDLVRLLAGVGTPAPDPAKVLPRNQPFQRAPTQQQQPKATQNHLLAMLNQKPIGATPVPSGLASPPQVQPHASKLLHLISQPTHSPTQPPPTSVSPSYHTAQSRPGSHPSSLSVAEGTGTEEDRAARARALLEISFAGLGLGDGSSGSSHTAGSPAQRGVGNQARQAPGASQTQARAPATQPAAQSQAASQSQVPAQHASGPAGYGNSPRSHVPPPSYDSVLRDGFPTQPQAAAHAPAPPQARAQTFERAAPPHIQPQPQPQPPVVSGGYVQHAIPPNAPHGFQSQSQPQPQPQSLAQQHLPAHAHMAQHQHHPAHPVHSQAFRPPPQAVPLGMGLPNMGHAPGPGQGPPQGQGQGQGYRPAQGQMPPPGMGPGPGPGYAPSGVNYYPPMPPQQQQQHFAPPPPAQAQAQAQAHQVQGYYPAQAPVGFPAGGAGGRAPGQGMYRQASGNVQPSFGYNQNQFPGGGGPSIPQPLPVQQQQQQGQQVPHQSPNKAVLNGNANTGTGILPGMHTQQGGQGQGGQVYHPVPRQPGNAGLLAMLNGGR